MYSTIALQRAPTVHSQSQSRSCLGCFYSQEIFHENRPSDRKYNGTSRTGTSARYCTVDRRAGTRVGEARECYRTRTLREYRGNSVV